MEPVQRTRADRTVRNPRWACWFDRRSASVKSPAEAFQGSGTLTIPTARPGPGRAVAKRSVCSEITWLQVRATLAWGASLPRITRRRLHELNQASGLGPSDAQMTETANWSSGEHGRRSGGQARRMVSDVRAEHCVSRRRMASVNCTGRAAALTAASIQWRKGLRSFSSTI